MTVDIFNLKKEKVGKTELPNSVFGLKWNPELIHQVLVAQLANRRQPWAHAKGRGEVRGGGRKPWRQKGTGRARHGSIRSPIWIGGGKAHGPSKERDYSKKINKKMNRLAILGVLSHKLKSEEIKIVDLFNFSPLKTKVASTDLKTFSSLNKKSKNFNLLLITGPESKLVARATRNLPKCKTLDAGSLNVYDLLNYRNLLIEESALPIIAKLYPVKRSTK